MTALASTAAQDEKLQASLDRSATEHEARAVQDRKDRRAVWLRLHEDHQYTYERLSRLTGYGHTTLYKEIQRARADRREAERKVSADGRART